MSYIIQKNSNDLYLDTLLSNKKRQLVNIVNISLNHFYCDTFKRKTVTDAQLSVNKKLIWSRLQKKKHINKSESGDFYLFFRDELLNGIYYMDMVSYNWGAPIISIRIPVINYIISKPGYNIKLAPFKTIKHLLQLQSL